MTSTTTMGMAAGQGVRTDRDRVADRAELRRSDGSPVRVLVVDDERTLSELLSMALRGTSHGVAA